MCAYLVTTSARNERLPSLFNKHRTEVLKEWFILMACKSLCFFRKKKNIGMGENTCHCFDYGRPFGADGGAYSAYRK